MFNTTTLIIPTHTNDGVARADITAMVERRIYHEFNGYTRADVIGCDPHCPTGHETMVQYTIAFQGYDKRARQILYDIALFVCDAMTQVGVYVQWCDGQVQFVGDPTDTIGAPIADAPIDHGIADAMARETWPIDRKAKGETRDETYRRTHGARIRARQIANRPW